MLTRWFHQFQIDWQNYARANATVFPTVGSYEQTRKSWAARVRDYDEIPECYQPYFEALKQSHQALPYTLKTPSFEGFLSPTNEKLLTLMDDSLLFYDRIDRKTSMQQVELGQIGHIELVSILLYSRISIFGMDDHQRPVRMVLRFNSVTEYLFQPVIEAFRLYGTPGSQGSSPLEAFDFLQDLNFKFMNFARRSVLPGESVKMIVLQPGIKHGLLRRRSKFLSRLVSPAHLAILTDRELIWIQDEPQTPDRAQYGGIWHYIRLNKLTKLTFAYQGLDMVQLALLFTDNSKLTFNYEIELLPQAEEMAENICLAQPGIELELLPR